MRDLAVTWYVTQFFIGWFSSCHGQTEMLITEISQHLSGSSHRADFSRSEPKLAAIIRDSYKYYVFNRYKHAHSVFVLKRTTAGVTNDCSV